MDFVSFPNEVQTTTMQSDMLGTSITVAVILLGATIIWCALAAWKRYRGNRVIVCPENHQVAAVQVDAVKAAVTGIAHPPVLRLNQCSRWPEKRNCGQECLRQIEAQPDTCLVRNILADWYKGKTCAYCGSALDKIDWLENRPGLRTPDGRQLSWEQFPPESVYEVLATHEPVCYNCHIAEKFRCEHPELVIDRPRS
jgi:hypothetical protein